MSDGVFVGDWDNAADVASNFEIDEKETGRILFAWYDDPYSYSGEAFVLFEKDGALFEANGSHCSCNGLEGQWEPEETTVTLLMHRMNEGHLGKPGDCDFSAELRAVLEPLASKEPTPEAGDE